MAGLTARPAGIPQALADGYRHTFLAIGVVLVGVAATALLLPTLRKAQDLRGGTGDDHHVR